MKYMLLIYADERASASASEEEVRQTGEAYEAFTQSIRSSGNYLDGDPFLPTTEATTVQVRDGKTGTSRGPAPAELQLQAYYKVEAEDADQAIAMATRVPGAHYGAIEVRPVVVFD